jgi:hypothetical protein
LSKSGREMFMVCIVWPGLLSENLPINSNSCQFLP